MSRHNEMCKECTVTDSGCVVSIPYSSSQTANGCDGGSSRWVHQYQSHRLLDCECMQQLTPQSFLYEAGVVC